jgi:hypothetical protein
MNNFAVSISHLNIYTIDIYLDYIPSSWELQAYSGELILQTADVLREVGYQINQSPLEITFPDSSLFRHDQVIIDEQGATHFVGVDRDSNNNREQRQANWHNFYQTSGGRRFVVRDNRLHTQYSQRDKLLPGK